MVSADPMVWLGGLLTLGFFSLLYRDNPLFRWAEVTYVSVAIGHTVVIGLNTLQTTLKPLAEGAKGAFILIIPVILGLLSLFVVWRRYAWLAAYPMSILIGVSLSMRVGRRVSSDIVRQLQSTVGDAATIVGGGDALTVLTAIISVIATITALTFFIFTREHRGVHRWSSRLGQYFLMICFGGYVANMLLSEIAFALNKMIYILKLWLGL